MGSGKEVKMKKKKRGARPSQDAPRAAPTPEQLAAARKLRELKKKEESIAAHAAVKKYLRKLKDKLLQPSRKHYGGLGYAKESVFLELGDPEYADKFETLWNEHVPGFSGKSFKKRKSEADDGMIWRKRLQAKAAGAPAVRIDEYISDLANAGSSKRRRTAGDAREQGRPVAACRNKEPLKATSTAPATERSAGESKATRRRKRALEETVVGDAASLQAQAIAAYRKLKKANSQQLPPQQVRSR